MPGAHAAVVRRVHTRKNFESNCQEESQDHDAISGVLGKGNSQVAPGEEEPKVLVYEYNRMGRVTFVAERACSRCVHFGPLVPLALLGSA